MPPRTERILSENATFQRLFALRSSRQQRRRQRAFLVEGVRQIDRAIAHGWEIRALLYPLDTRRSSWAADALTTSEAEVHYALAPALHRKLSGRNEGSELLALVGTPDDDLARIAPGDPPLIVVVDRSHSPGNLGTAIRSCDALGADGLIMTGHAVDLYHPDTVAASIGSLFALPVVRAPSHHDLLPLFERIRRDFGDLQLVATSAHAPHPLYDCNFWRPTVLLVGNETDGLSRAYRDLADIEITIPMQGSATSLNVACATSILLYEARRQVRR